MVVILLMFSQADFLVDAKRGEKTMRKQKKMHIARALNRL